MVWRQMAVRKLQIIKDKPAQSTYRDSHSRTESPQAEQVSAVKWHQECYKKRKGNRMPEPVCNLFTEDAVGIPCG
jgi:hypothetical protein